MSPNQTTETKEKMMMAALMLFGLSLRPLYDAIAQVESDRGATSANVYQIRPIYVDDVNRILQAHVYTYQDRLSKERSEAMMRVYWAHWGKHYEEKTGNRVTYQVLARLHNGGSLCWKKQATMTYWLRVKKVLEAMKAK